MKASQVVLALQATLQIPELLRAPVIGPRTRAAIRYLTDLDADAEYECPVGQATNEGHAPSNLNLDTPPMPTGAHRQISQRGLDLVRSFEGLFLKAYKDGGGVWTIGWGHTGLTHMDGTVYPGRVITKEEADALLKYDMNQFEARVQALVKVPLNDDQFAALVSFDFNSGGLTLDGGKPSGVLNLVNKEAFTGAANELLRWDHDNGKRVAGLTRRRNAERCLFLSDYDGMNSFLR